MPDWQPNWSDVRFAHAEATEAAEACRTATRRLGELGGRRDGLAADVDERPWASFDPSCGGVDTAGDALDSAADTAGDAADSAYDNTIGRLPGF